MKGDALDPEIPLPDEAFGFGRRYCAGQDSARASLWITIASLLAVFKFEGEEGKMEKDYGDYVEGFVQYVVSKTHFNIN
jgi:cytochrome P450